MAHYVIDQQQNYRSTPGVLIGVPLILTVVFCFGFVLYQPTGHRARTPAAASRSVPANTEQQTQLPPLTFAKPSQLPTLTPSSDKAASVVPDTRTPQPTSQGGINLQASKTAGIHPTIIVPKASGKSGH